MNTFYSGYSRAAGLQTIFTTKSGTDQFHGSASDWFNYQGMFASQHFRGISHTSHSTRTIWISRSAVRSFPHHNSFFYFAVEPLRSSASAGGSVTFAAPEFISFAQTNYPDTVGTHILTTYLPSGIAAPRFSRQRHDVFGSRGMRNRCRPNGVPCNLPMIDTRLVWSHIRSAMALNTFARIDQGFKKERIYVSLFRTLLLTGAASPMPQFSALNNTWQVAGQAVVDAHLSH